ncbi:MAG: ATP-binding cassette domain-containing protein [Proteobacteria bacterium]|nr:MAG: ATP-binding cassette domain-containing protein [Pseudomonadota bacterium]
MFFPLKKYFDFVFFRAAVPAIRLARLRPLESEDLPAQPASLHPSAIPPALFATSTESGAALLWGITRVLKKPLSLSLLLAMLYAFCILSGPLLVYSLVDFVRDAALGRAELSQGLWAGFLLCATTATTGLLQHHYFFNCLKLFQIVVSAINIRVYRQGLLLTRKARMNRQTGDVVNLLGTDSDILSFFHFEMVEFIIRVFMIISASAMLIFLLGWASVIGLGTLLLIAPMAHWIAKRYRTYDDEIMAHRDSRVSLMSSILSGIRIVKYFAWEKEMLSEVDRIRVKEIAARRKLFNITAGSTLIYFGGSLLIGAVSFISALLMGQTLDAPTLFSALALFGILDSSIGILSEIVSIIVSGRVSADRVAGFLRDPVFAEKIMTEFNGTTGFIVKNASFQFEDGDEPVLNNLNLSIRPGESVAVIGSVGSGKTALLLSLLGEIPQVSGEFSWTHGSSHANIGYVPQEALIMNGTLRENIELGIQVDPLQLEEAIAAAALTHDIRMLSGGLEAEIGEQGINLSGGQKQRVNLARAACRKVDILLLDDPVSAVDFHTENAVMDNLIFGLWKDKTRVVVTHRLQHLNRFDRVLFFHRGAIIGDGRYEDLLEHNAAFRILLQRSQKEDHELETKPVVSTAIEKTSPDESVRLTDDESRQIGSVQLTVYKNYAKAWLGEKPHQMLAVLLVMTLFAIGIPVLQQWWIAYWSDHKESFDLTMLQAVLIWSGLGLLAVISALLFQRLWLLRAQSAGRAIHDSSITALLRSPLNYFDRTPIGRILNRFSRDMDSVEREIAQNLERTIGPILHTLAAVLIILFNVPLLIVVIAPALYAYYALQKLYRSASRDAQRLASIARSPRFAFFKESLQASALIRAHGQTEVFVAKYEGLLSDYLKRFYGSILFNRWFSSRIPMLGGAITFGLIGAILWLSQSGKITAGIAGLTLVYALRLCDHLNNAIRSFTVVESNMIGVERLSELRHLPSEIEPLGNILENELWPEEGEIRFEHVSVRYASHLPLVLKDCDFTLKARQKIGIIGRTGAGKSTLFQVLYRFIPPTSGRVLIDGVDAATIPLEKLRRSLAIIPQDPVLFQGTLRSNIDRFRVYSDDSLWTALRRAHLEEWVRSLPGGLETELKESGSNFSQGRRQQVCLARALLLNTKIIVLDEATASVDVVTDALIQQTLQDECKDKTVLIIAHRLETLSLCDRVIEMRDGRPHFIR